MESISLSPVAAFLDTSSVPTHTQPPNNMAIIPTIKIEEPTTITPDLLMGQATDMPAKPEGKSVKKRKSWGQVLPEPKTSLPPRKRAKTADEKEQRRIERVKRNRLAAHNSRERKRQEMDELEAENHKLQDRIKQLEAEVQAFKSGNAHSVPSFEFSKPITTSSISPAITAYTSNTLSTPELSTLDSPRGDSPEDYSQPATPVPEEINAHEATFVEQTQQSAALLCDLQCRSTTRSSNSPSSATSPSALLQIQQPTAPASFQQTPASTALLVILQLFLSNLSTLSSIWSRTNLPTTTTRISSSPEARRLYTATCLMTMLARLQTTSTFSPTQVRDLYQVATSLAPGLMSQLSRSSSTSSSSSSERGQGRRQRRDGARRSEDRATRLIRRRRERRERYQKSDTRRNTSFWVNKRGVQLACDSVMGDRSTTPSIMAWQKLRERGVRR